jgi:CheY-like chemotaxis protein
MRRRPEESKLEALNAIDASADSGRPGPIPAIAVTAYARAEDRQRSLLAGYQMHLAKPIEARELVAGIASLLHLRR